MIAFVATLAVASGFDGVFGPGDWVPHEDKYLSRYTSQHGATCFGKEEAQSNCVAAYRDRIGSCGGINWQPNECNDGEKKWTLREGTAPKLQPAHQGFRGGMAMILKHTCQSVKKWLDDADSYLSGYSKEEGSTCFTKDEAQRRCVHLYWERYGACGGINWQPNECNDGEKKWTLREGTVHKRQPNSSGYRGGMASILTFSCSDFYDFSLDSAGPVTAPPLWR